MPAAEIIPWAETPQCQPTNLALSLRVRVLNFLECIPHRHILSTNCVNRNISDTLFKKYICILLFVLYLPNLEAKVIMHPVLNQRFYHKW